MNNQKLTTLDRIQLEIKESLEREQQLKYDYNKIKAGNSIEDSAESSGKSTEIDRDSNVSSSSSSVIAASKLNANGFRKFFRNANSSKGVMQKFLKSHGRIIHRNNNNINNSLLSSDIWTSDATFKPAKITVQKGTKSIRNGYISAEEKMRKELQEFQQRETQLREERKKSLPNLMASLHLEEQENNHNGFVSDFYHSNGLIKATKSMANIYNHCNSDDGFEDTNSSAGGSLKPARSLAELCDVSDDDECDLPDTHSLIMRFENMKFKNKSHQ